jgi:HPr kinase/phosphorylase
MEDRPEPEPEPISRWGAGRDGAAIWLNATGVAVDGQGIAILGAPGSGKSSLALELMARGATLIADDGLWLTEQDAAPVLARPAQAPDLIEARGIGLIHAGATCARAPLALVVDMDRGEDDRLPPRRLVAIGPALRPLIRGAGQPTLPSALMLIARHGRAEI